MGKPPEGLNQVPEAAQKIPPQERLRQASTTASVYLQEAAGLIDGGSQQAVDLRGRIGELQAAKAQLGQALPAVTEAELLERQIEDSWLAQVHKDAYTALPGVYVTGYGDLQVIRTLKTSEMAGLQSARFGRFWFRGQIHSTQTALQKLDEYDRKYQEQVAPHKSITQALALRFGEIQGRLAEVIVMTAEKAVDETRLAIQQIRQKRTEAIADPNWQAKATQQYLQTHLDPALEEAVKTNQLKREDAEAIRLFISKYFTQGIPPEYPGWNLSQEEQDKIRAKRAEYDVEYKSLSTKMGYRLDDFCRTVNLNGRIQPPALIYDQIAEVITDLAMGNIVRQAEKVLFLLEDKKHYGTTNGYYDFESRLSTLAKEAKYNSKPNQGRYELKDVTGINCWQIVAQRLIDKGVLTQDEVKDAETQLIWYLTNQILIPGGHESWPGTAAVSQIADLGNPKGLEGILLYQGLTAGPTGLYPAGHTNNAADYARERMMAKMSDADIEALDSPRFIKRVLLAFKHPTQSDLVSNEYREVWNQLDGYGRSRLTAELFGREFKEILEEVKTDPSINKRWVVVALRGVGAVIGELAASDYELLSQLAAQDSSVRTEVLRMLAHRIEGLSVAFAHHEQTDADLAAKALVEIINHPEYKVDDEDLIALFKARKHLGIKLKLPAFPKAERDKAAARADQIGGKIFSWIDSNSLSERQLLIALQAIDVLEDPKYAPLLLRESRKLLLQGGLEQRYGQSSRQLYGRYGDKIIMLKNWNRHSVYETLADIALRTDFILKFRPAGEIAIIQAFKQNPDAREGINKVFKDGTNNQEMVADPARQEDYISEYISLLAGPSEYTELINGSLEWRIDFLKCQTTTDLIAGAVAGGGEAARRLLPLVVKLTTRYRQDEKKVIHRKLAESCQGFLTSENQLDKLYAVISLATIEWESNGMRQVIDELYQSEEIVLDGKKPRDVSAFQEVYEQYVGGYKDIKMLRRTAQAAGEMEPVDERAVSDAIVRLLHRADRGSTMTDYELLTKLVEDPRGLPSAVEPLLVSLSRFPQAPFFYNVLITASIFEKMDDASIRQPLLETARRVTNPHFLEVYGTGGVNVQLDVVRRLINGLKEARQAQRVTPGQTTEIVNVIKSNDALYRQALRSLNA